MIGMVIVRARAHHNVGLPFPDEAREHAAIFHSGQKLAIMDVQHLRRDAENFGGGFDLSFAPERQWAASLPPVADIAVRHRNKLHLVPLRSPHRRHTASLKLAIVGMRAETDDAQFAAIVGSGESGSEGEKRQSNQKYDGHAGHLDQSR